MATEKIISCILSLCNSAPTLGSSTRVPVTHTWRHFVSARRQFSDKKSEPDVEPKIWTRKKLKCQIFFAAATKF